MKRKFDNILETVGNTPVVRINKLAPAGINLYVKIEAFNPLGSVKDRLALGVIEDAERTGALKPGQTVVEATSGNTGIGLAMVCAQKGYPLVVTMAETFSIERRKLMRFLGAKVVITPAPARGIGMVAKGQRARREERLVPHPPVRPTKPTPTCTPAPPPRRSSDDFEGERLDYWVTGFGTGGTLKGVSRVLAEGAPRDENHRLRARRRAHALERHPAAAQPRRLRLRQPSLLDTRTPSRAGAPTSSPSSPGRRRHQPHRPGPPHHQRRRHALEPANSPSKEGIFVGISSGATFAGALRVAAEAPKGSTILCMLPDTGERYLSTPLFADVPVDMTPEELELSQSTPSAQLPPPPAS